MVEELWVVGGGFVGSGGKEVSAPFSVAFAAGLLAEEGKGEESKEE